MTELGFPPPDNFRKKQISEAVSDALVGEKSLDPQSVPDVNDSNIHAPQYGNPVNSGERGIDTPIIPDPKMSERLRAHLADREKDLKSESAKQGTENTL